MNAQQRVLLVFCLVFLSAIATAQAWPAEMHAMYRCLDPVGHHEFVFNQGLIIDPPEQTPPVAPPGSPWFLEGKVGYVFGVHGAIPAGLAELRHYCQRVEDAWLANQDHAYTVAVSPSQTNYDEFAPGVYEDKTFGGTWNAIWGTPCVPLNTVANFRNYDTLAPHWTDSSGVLHGGWKDAPMCPMNSLLLNWSSHFSTRDPAEIEYDRLHHTTVLRSTAWCLVLGWKN